VLVDLAVGYFHYPDGILAHDDLIVRQFRNYSPAVSKFGIETPAGPREHQLPSASSSFPIKCFQVQFNANVLSVNRQKWIETMRDLVASLNSQLLAAAALRCVVEEPTGLVIAQDRELLGAWRLCCGRDPRSNSCSTRSRKTIKSLIA
jgi:hypothetical protein